MIRKLFKQMLVTQILSSMTVMLCMLVDSIMIGRFLGVDSMTAYGYATPILLVFAALGNMVSAGVQVMCGRTMASGDKDGTDACFSMSVFLAVAISVVGMAVILIFTDPICTLLGAGENTPDNEVFRLTRAYLQGFIIGAPAFIGAQIMVPYMQISGNRTRLVVAVGLMTAGDIALDILNVFVFKKGTFGMGLASSISYYIAFFIGLAYFFKKKCAFHFRKKLVKMSVFKEMAIDGLPTLINQISLVFLMFTLNKLLSSVGGNHAVAAYSVISTIGNICYSFSAGNAAVALMLSSIFYTDEDKTSLRSLVGTMIFCGVFICSIVTALVIVFAKPLVELFIEDRDAMGMAITGLRIFIISLVPCSINTALKNYYQGIEQAKLTNVISVLQNFVLVALTSVILSFFAKVTGIWFGFIGGETLTLVIICIIVFARAKKVKFTTEAFSMLPSDYGVTDDNTFEISLSTVEEIASASEKSTHFCLNRGLDAKKSALVGVSIEEMANNIVSYGFTKDKKEHTIDIRLTLKDGVTTLRIRDNCVHFDPVRFMEMHRTDESVEHLGIRMVMKMATDAKYVNSLGFNYLILTF